ncbi:MAG: RusA family crossover junction endodeoxyribonuclease [Synergistaceae bacterium]|nr:RusA family crossover junction endodeoxyribonuclease [Synergistaceae bacterium]
MSNDSKKGVITISELLRIMLKGLPPTVNHMYRTGRNGIRYKRMEVEEWQEEVSGIIREAWGEKPPYEGNVEVRVIFMVKDNRRWDIDNRLKALFDCLEEGGAIKNDTQIWGETAHRVLGKEDTTEIEMMKYTGGGRE